MRLSVSQFQNWPNKAITLLGMSGVGKTRLSCILRLRDWFHYSVDYRIGTRYLSEPILDNIKRQMMQIPFLRDLLRADAIYIGNNITIDNLKPVSTFLGKLGNPLLGGLSLEEFKRRQSLHRAAEIAALRDVPDFIRKAQELYGYRHLVNDAGGSLCELDDPQVLEVLSQHTLILYIRATEHDEHELIRRAEADPKPLYYREAFLDEQLAMYLHERSFNCVSLIDPDDFVRWVFLRLFQSRLPRYEQITNQYGYTVTTEEVAAVQDEAGFLALVETVIQRQS